MIIGKKTSGMVRQLFREVNPMACQASGEELCISHCYMHGLHALLILQEALGTYYRPVTVEKVYEFLSESLSEVAVQRVWGAIAEEELVVSEADCVVLFQLFREASGTICHKVHDEEICLCHQRSYDAVQAIAGVLGCMDMTSQEIAELIRKAMLPYSLQAFVRAYPEVEIEMLPALAYVVGPENIKGKVLPRVIFSSS